MLQKGDRLGGYVIGDLIGVGGMAVVYSATQVSLSRVVALKVLSLDVSSDDTFRERFRREGLQAARLEHPNIVPVHEAGEIDDVMFIAMRLVEGGTLASRIRESGLSSSTALRHLRQIADALDTAHASGLVHRDIKPPNILLTRAEHPYLADFGIAKTHDAVALTGAGGFVGSAAYASPEQIRGDEPTAASDIYSLTAVLYECLAGQTPFPCGDVASTLHAHLTQPPPDLKWRLDGVVPRDLARIVRAGLAKDPAARPETAGQLIEQALRSFRQISSESDRVTPLLAKSQSPEGDHSSGRSADSKGTPTHDPSRRRTIAETFPDESKPWRKEDRDARSTSANDVGRTILDHRRSPSLMSSQPRQRVALEWFTRRRLTSTAAALIAIAALVAGLTLFGGSQQNTSDESDGTGSSLGVVGAESRLEQSGSRIDAEALFTGGKDSTGATACGACHTLSVTGGGGRVTGPSLDEAVKGWSAARIRDAIIDPNAEIADGFAPHVMPVNYDQTLTPAEVDALARFVNESVNG